MSVRRVVTGHDDAGKAVFASEEEVEPRTVAMLPGAEFHMLWGADSPPTLPDPGSQPSWNTYFPPVGGFRFILATLPPDDVQLPADFDAEAAAAEFEEKLPGVLATVEPDNPGMHTSDTIDFDVVLSGQVILELDDGVERLLRPGDTVVQNGTRHRWKVPGPEPTVMAIFLIGANRARAGS
jgi:quercetin dioxygenase-like cupin family protein